MLKLIGALACLIAAAAASASPTSHGLPRGDGSDIVYHLDRTPARGRGGLLLMLQGSGCEPVLEREWLRSEPPVLAPGRAVIAIEKYGVVPGSPQIDAVEGCASAYWHGNTLRQRVLDAVQVVSRLRREKWWNGELILYGGSEGGAVAAMLAPLLPETEAVIILSSGIGMPVGEMILSAVPPQASAELARLLAESRSNPAGDRRFGGASFRWWADAAAITPAVPLLQSRAPILLIHGARDQFAPVAAARATRDLFARAGNRNLTYLEYPELDHGMTDRTGADQRPLVLNAAARWLAQRRRQRR
jgi:alpha-beta hydrolase superfamily lysophospholipase